VVLPAALGDTLGWDDIWDRAAHPQGSNEYTSARVVIVGHAGDARAWECLNGERETCARRLVVDRVVWVEGQSVEPAAHIDARLDHLKTAEAQSRALAALPDGSRILTLTSSAAIDAPSVDPRIRAGVDGRVWVARAVTGSAESDGSAPMQEVVIDDATGRTVQQLPVDPGPAYQPAILALEADLQGTSGYNGNTPFFSVESMAGGGIVGGTLGLFARPPVVEPGAYTLRAWLANFNLPTLGPAHDGCRKDVQVEALATVGFTATFPDTGHCSWASNPFPTPFQ
jgi:hypothetical protein